MGNDHHINDWSARSKVTYPPCSTPAICTHACVIFAILSPQFADVVGEHIHTVKPVHRGDTIYRAGEPAYHRLLIVRSGSVKITLAYCGGREVTYNYRLPCDILGLDGLHADTQIPTIVALETIQLWLSALLIERAYSERDVYLPPAHLKITDGCFQHG